ncbi:putative reverse transcriptase domain-containing protein [Tanacetum coccineum]
MPPRRFKMKSIRKIVEKHVAKAIEEYEKTRSKSNNAGGSGSANTEGTVTPEMHGCSYKTFTNGKPHSFSGTEGVVGLKCWFEKIEQVFEICKCAEDDKIPRSNIKYMMTTEYCPSTKIQWMEQELWTLTLKGNDIEAYNNFFHELVLMCLELVSTERKKIEKYIRGLPERIKGNITSSKPATLHDAIIMARELVEQAVQGRATRIGESNKRKWEDKQRNTNNNNHNNNNNNRNRNNNHDQQQNRRQENVRAYAIAPAGGDNFLQNVTCFGCGEKGHFKDRCPRARNQQNEGAHGRAYVVIKNRQQNLNVATGASPVVRSPYRLASSEMFELSNQLKKLQEKGLIRPSHSPWEAPVLFVKKKDEEEHEVHLKTILDLLKKEKLYAKFSKCKFWLQEVQFLGHVVNRDGIHVDPSKVESVKNWKPPEVTTESVHTRIAGLYRRTKLLEAQAKLQGSQTPAEIGKRIRKDL